LGLGPEEDVVRSRSWAGRHDFLGGSRNEVGPVGKWAAVDFGHSEGDLGQGRSVGRHVLVMGLENSGQERGFDV
jgi:hypothetical protein